MAFFSRMRPSRFPLGKTIFPQITSIVKDNYFQQEILLFSLGIFWAESWQGNIYLIQNLPFKGHVCFNILLRSYRDGK